MSESLIIITLVMTTVPISLFYIEKAVLINKQKNNLIKQFESKLDRKKQRHIVDNLVSSTQELLN